jgi:hypothetical protein
MSNYENKAQTKADSPEEIDATSSTTSIRPIFWGTESFVRLFTREGKRFLFDGRAVGEPIEQKEMKRMAVPYCKRVKKVKDKDGEPKADLTLEKLIIYINKKQLLDFINSAGSECEGLMAILAVQPKKKSDDPQNQTFILVPHDEQGKVLPLGDAGFVGLERWPTHDRTVAQIIELGNGDIKKGIDEHFSEIGFPPDKADSSQTEVSKQKTE